MSHSGVAVEMQELVYEVLEGEESVTVCAQLIGMAEHEVEVELNTVGDPG